MLVQSYSLIIYKILHTIIYCCIELRHIIIYLDFRVIARTEQFLKFPFLFCIYIYFLERPVDIIVIERCKK